jgi:8-oxo-dGTP pyrophosphatase MutT (NUDIX family)
MINCSVTVMPIYLTKIGFIKRSKGDTYPELLVAPGGKIEKTDGKLLDNVPYFSAEMAAIREIKEEIEIDITINQLIYFCSLTLPNDRIVISFYADLNVLNFDSSNSNLIFLTKEQIVNRLDFAPGMKEEALLLMKRLGIS